MHAAAQPEFFDFPVIAQKAKRPGILSQYLEAQREHGMIVPLSMATVALGLSRQRVHVLVDQGRLASLMIADKCYIPLIALELFLTEERKSGIRKWPAPGLGALVKSTLAN
jgi:hypothetical protein